MEFMTGNEEQEQFHFKLAYFFELFSENFE
jgi:hypothetical protein